MTCQISRQFEGVAVCGGFRQRKYHYFTKKRDAVLFSDSLWYEPNLVSKLKRKKNERIDYFEARVKKKLGFLPMTFRGWWKVVAVPQFRAMEQEREVSK